MSSNIITKATADSTPDELVALAKRLGKELFADRAAEYDRKAEFPTENYKDLHGVGLLALTIPAEYGGVGASYETYCRVSAELGRWCGATASSSASGRAVRTFSPG